MEFDVVFTFVFVDDLWGDSFLDGAGRTDALKTLYRIDEAYISDCEECGIFSFFYM